jgi:chromosome segregation ATPase
VCLALAALVYGAFTAWHGGTHQPVIPAEVMARAERWSAKAKSFKKLVTGELQSENTELKAELEKSRAANLRLSDKLASQTKEEARVTASLKQEEDTLRNQLAEADRRGDRLERQISQQKKRVSLAQLDAQNEHQHTMSWRQRAENLEKESSQEKVEVTAWHQKYTQSEHQKENLERILEESKQKVNSLDNTQRSLRARLQNEQHTLQDVSVRMRKFKAAELSLVRSLEPMEVEVVQASKAVQ